MSIGTGTIDHAPYLSVSAAFVYRSWLGGEKKINDYCHQLAIEGGKKLAEVLGTEVMDSTDGAEGTGNMVCSLISELFDISHQSD
jgi:hercynylcysteine S-oxide lyase